MTKDKLIELAQVGMGIHSPNTPEYVVCEALIKALAQPEQEPVAWMVYTQEGQSAFVTDNPAQIHPSQRALPLYATPQQVQESVNINCPSCLHSFAVLPVAQRTWVGLTKEERDEICLGDESIARSIEAKLRDKNGGNHEP
jgi:hypothetical protein